MAEKQMELTEEEIRVALQHSGFPLEIRLLERLHAEGLDPVIGHRFMMGAEHSAEVDLMAGTLDTLANNRGILQLKMMIEAKQLGKGVAFVGFKWRSPDNHSLRATRLRLSGRPTCQVLSRVLDRGRLSQLMIGGHSPIAECLDELNDAAVCPQWSYVRRNEKHAGQIEARKEDAARESFSKLVRVTTVVERDNAEWLTRSPGDPALLRMQIMSPTIVLGTPHLYLYDPVQKTMEKTARLILQEMHESAGEVHRRYIDVVTEDALPELIGVYRRTAEKFKSACDDQLHELDEIAEHQRLCQIEIDSEDEEGRPTIFTS